MSNVRIEATGEESLTVEVILGANSRAKHSVEAGQSVDLAVGGGQRLVVREFVAEGTTAAEEEGDLPTGRKSPPSWSARSRGCGVPPRTSWPVS